MSDSMSTPGDATSAPASSAYVNYVLGVLFIVYVFNFVDRQVLSVFIGPIKAEFGASDTEMGLLVGFAFAVLYTFAGIPIARWADRGNRRNIIVLGLTVWSAMTSVCGFTKSFLQLFLARVGVGLGEAAGTPPAHSLISDYFPAHKRATALAIYASAVHIGASVAYLGGSYLRENLDWRTAFLLLGAPGILFALVVRFTVREPLRGYADQHKGSVEPISFMETLRFLLGSRTWVLLITGAAFIALTGYGVMMWGYEFFGRVHKMSPVEVGKWLALIGVGGIVGSLMGGRIADSAFRHMPARMISVPALWTLACLPFGIVSMLTDTRWLVLTCFAIFSFLLNFYLPAVYSGIQSLAKLQMRATAVAILLFVINLIGAGVGPLLVGGLSDFFAPQFGAESIRYALLIVMLFGGIGCVFLLLSSRHFEQDLLRAKR